MHDLISDHLPVIAVQKKIMTKLYELTFSGRSYRHYNKQDLIEKLIYYDWSTFHKSKDPNIQWGIMIGLIMEYLDEVCPVKERTVRTRDVDWMRFENSSMTDSATWLNFSVLN